MYTEVTGHQLSHSPFSELYMYHKYIEFLSEKPLLLSEVFKSLARNVSMYFVFKLFQAVSMVSPCQHVCPGS